MKLSIICLAYNQVRFIRDALEGFVRQKTNFPFEVIIHDDASTDGTTEIIKEYEHKYPNIIKPIYQTENKWSKGKDLIKSFIYLHIKGEYVKKSLYLKFISIILFNFRSCQSQKNGL